MNVIKNVKYVIINQMNAMSVMNLLNINQINNYVWKNVKKIIIIIQNIIYVYNVMIHVMSAKILNMNVIPVNHLLSYIKTNV